MPRRMISMASVTMKAFRRRPTTIKPLMKPIRPPTRSTARMPTLLGSSKPKPKLAAGTTEHGADRRARSRRSTSSDRSNLPVMMISDSASTTRASAADEVRMVMMLAGGQEDRADQRADDDEQDERRQERKIAQPAPMATRLRRGRRGFGDRIGSCCFVTLQSLQSKRRERCRSIPPCARRRSRHGA